MLLAGEMLETLIERQCVPHDPLSERELEFDTDERLLHEEDGPRDHSTMMKEFREAAARQPELYYRFVVRTTIAGLESVLADETDAATLV